MSWRHILVNVLLVLPSSWIFAAATFESQDVFDRGENKRVAEDEKLIDEIIAKLIRANQQDGNIPTESIDKKTSAIVQEVSDKNGGGQDVENPDPVPEARKTEVNLQVINGVDVDGGTKTDQGQSNQGGSQPQGVPGKASPLQDEGSPEENRSSGLINTDDKIFIIIVTVTVSTGFMGLMLAGVCYFRFHKRGKATSNVEYPAYGVTGPIKERIPSPGDRKLAQSAQMYHYQHQKQQMVAMERANIEMKHDASEDDSEEDNIEGDYTVYECPGLAPTGEMEVRNPLFRGEETPVTSGQDITGKPHEQEPSHKSEYP